MKASDKLISISNPVSELCYIGIYFLLDDDYEVVYVGQSINFNSRLSYHIKDKKFTHYAFVEMPSATNAELRFAEAEYITKYNPKYNKDLGSSSDGKNSYISLGSFCRVKCINSVVFKTFLQNFDVEYKCKYKKDGTILKKYKRSQLDGLLSKFEKYEVSDSVKKYVNKKEPKPKVHLKYAIESRKKIQDLKIIIAGGRDFNDYEKLKKKCNSYIPFISTNKPITIISGGAKGADSLGEKYAIEMGYKIEKFIPEWDKLGKYAGIKRNKDMAKYADALLAFHDGVSKGTSNMITEMKNLGKFYRVINYESC